MEINCPKCKKTSKLSENKGSIALLKGGNEHIDTYFYCNDCYIYFIDEYCDNFMTDDSSSGQRVIDNEIAEKAINMIKQCHDPLNKKCNCKIHLEFFKSNT